ncbi:unnamed protein product [Wuchereria bancrofti]|nr:unnamed protein product [Wuchereria bancrofti]
MHHVPRITHLHSLICTTTFNTSRTLCTHRRITQLRTTSHAPLTPHARMYMAQQLLGLSPHRGRNSQG